MSIAHNVASQLPARKTILQKAWQYHNHGVSQISNWADWNRFYRRACSRKIWVQDGLPILQHSSSPTERTGGFVHVAISMTESYLFITPKYYNSPV